MEDSAEKASEEKKQIQRDLFGLKEQYQGIKNRVAAYEERIQLSEGVDVGMLFLFCFGF